METSPSSRIEARELREDSEPTEGFYNRWSRRGWPRSYGAKLWLLAVLALGGPLLLGLLTHRAFPARSPGLLVTGLLGLAVGGALLAVALRRVTRPIREAREALEGYFDRGEIGSHRPLREDEAGRLRHQVIYLLEHLDARGTLLRSLPAKDYSTGLPNRAAAKERLQQSRELALRDHLPLTLALVDVVDLRGINEAHGYHLGDRFLTGVAQRLLGQLRESDWAARWGDDEFLLVLFSDREGAESALERVLQDVKTMRVVAGGRAVSGRVRIGAVPVDRSRHLQGWLERVEEALEEARSRSTDLVVRP
ncbi:MAG: GGDEF domain-containing protein [Thermoanaerobaculia bacterium]|nr:GGDEF domain-containing protein [Thermoanaerobaculia bacterium]